MRTRNHGKYTKMSMRHPQAIARCDYSGLMVAYRDLGTQMQYSGSGLVSTGLRVHPHFMDKPNPQNLVPLVGLDPKPIPNTRPDTQIGNQNTMESTLGVKHVTLDINSRKPIVLEEHEKSIGRIVLQGIYPQQINLFLYPAFNEIQIWNEAVPHDEAPESAHIFVCLNDALKKKEALTNSAKYNPRFEIPLGESFWVVMDQASGLPTALKRVYHG